MNLLREMLIKLRTLFNINTDKNRDNAQQENCSYNIKMKPHTKHWMTFKKNLRLLFGKRFYIKKTSKLIYLIDMRNRIDRTIDAFSAYEKPQIEFLFSQLKDKNCACFIDVGAHWGYYSMLFAIETSFNQAEIHAFEPDKINRYQLYANLFLNKLHDRITVYDYALSSEEGELRFHHFDKSNRGKSCITSDGEATVKTKKLDSLIDITGKVIGIKIDVEGHELNVISGMSELLSNNHCILQIESFSEPLPFLISKMSDLGYSNINNIESDHYFSNF